MAAVDTERFRLRRFVERLVQLGECESHDQPIDLIDVAAVLEGNPRATWFKAVGPEKAELVGNVMGSRKRLAIALDTDEAGLLPEIAKRLANPIKPVKVAAKDAPVQQVVLQGEEADLCALPVHLQHGEDGAPYISAGLDVMKFRDTGHHNIGCRRIMLRGPRSAGIDMIAPSDARAIYLEAVARGEQTPVAYVVGSHPCDFMAAVSMNPPMDELEVLGAMRGSRRCRSSNASPATSTCRPMPNTCWRAISTTRATSSRKGRSANTSATTASSNAIRCSTSPRSPAARTRCSRPRPSAASIWRAPTPRSSPR